MEGKKISMGLDLRTPINASLTAFYKRSFAFYTVKDRIPIILTQTIDLLSRNKDDILKFYGLDAGNDLKAVIGEISKLKYEIQTNKPLIEIDGVDDAHLYNQYLEEEKIKIKEPTAFNAQWLHLECYVYRRLMAAIQKTSMLRDLDPFLWQKEDSFTSSMIMIAQLGTHILKMLADNDCDREKEFINLLKLNLWGNKCDLSFSCGVVKEEASHMDNLEKLNEKILSDDSAFIWQFLSEIRTTSDIVDIILDNAGYELFSDLCLADCMVRFKLAKQIRFYVKAIPWFVSDVTVHDFNWTLEQLRMARNASLKSLGDKWAGYLNTAIWSVERHDFWTSPYSYRDMKRIDPDLYTKLAGAKLAVFKGDLNYRKLLGERNWPHEAPFAEALRGFHPTRICALRTIKADLVCGLPKGADEKAEMMDANWMTKGAFGVIQFCGKVDDLT